MPNDLISDDSWEKPEPGTKWFLPGEDRDACEPGPNSIMEYDMRQFVSYSECMDLVFNLGAFLYSSQILFYFVSNRPLSNWRRIILLLTKFYEEMESTICTSAGE